MYINVLNGVISSILFTSYMLLRKVHECFYSMVAYVTA